MPGTIVVVNGPSSAGKTTLANGTRSALGLRTVAVPIDRLFSMAHPDHPLNWELYAALTAATFAAAAAFAKAGFKVIVDIVFERRDCFETAERVLAGFDHQYVAVTCGLDELERRELARGNRPLGLARRQQTSVLHDVPYALRIDTTSVGVNECVTKLVQLFSA